MWGDSAVWNFYFLFCSTYIILAGLLSFVGNENMRFRDSLMMFVICILSFIVASAISFGIVYLVWRG